MTASIHPHICGSLVCANHPVRDLAAVKADVSLAALAPFFITFQGMTLMNGCIETQINAVLCGLCPPLKLYDAGRLLGRLWGAMVTGRPPPFLTNPLAFRLVFALRAILLDLLHPVLGGRGVRRLFVDLSWLGFSGQGATPLKRRARMVYG